MGGIPGRPPPSVWNPDANYNPQSLRECIVFGRCVCLSVCRSVCPDFSVLSSELLHKQALYFLRSWSVQKSRRGLYLGFVESLLTEFYSRSRATTLLRTYVPGAYEPPEARPQTFRLHSKWSWMVWGTLALHCGVYALQWEFPCLYYNRITTLKLINLGAIPSI